MNEGSSNRPEDTLYPSAEILHERKTALDHLESLTPAIRWSRRGGYRRDLERRRDELEAAIRRSIARNDAIKVYEVRVRPSGNGWEIAIPGMGTTRVAHPDAVDAGVRAMVARQTGEAEDQFEWVYAP